MNWYGGKSVMKRKGLVIAGLVAGLSVLTSMTAFAENSHQFIRDDGIMTFVYDYRNEWVWRDPEGDGIEECYYFNDIGEMSKRKMTPDNYMTDSTGAWVQDGMVQRHVSDKTPINVSIYNDEVAKQKIFNIEGVEIRAMVPATSNYSWIRGGWTWDPSSRISTGTNYCTIEDINFYKCSYESVLKDDLSGNQRVLALTFIINGKMTQRNNSKTGYVGGQYNFFDTVTNQKYHKGPGGYHDSFISAKRTKEDTIYGFSVTDDLEVGDAYYTDITLCVPVGVNSCTLEFYEE